MIRKAKNSDLETCRKIIFNCFDNSVDIGPKEKEFFKKTYLDPKYLKEKKDNYDLYVYEKDKHVIGMGLFEEGWIKKIFITPKYQGKGIGGEIYDRLESIGIKRGYKKFKAYCFPNSVKFAQRKGFEIKKRVFFKKDGYKFSATYMEKTYKENRIFTGMAKIGIKTRVGMVMFHKGKLVVTKHDVEGYGIFYLLPGGGIEHSESPEETMKREALEECGVEVEPERLLWIKTGYTEEDDYLDLIYLVNIKKGNFKVHKYEKMVKKIEFISNKEELSKLKFFPKQIINKVFKELPKETEYLGKFKYPED